MARKETTIYTYTDDLTGDEVPEDEFQTVEFTYGGTTYSIDLGPKNAKKLDDFLAPYIDKARKTNTNKGRGTKRVPLGQRDLSGRDLNAVRKWARESGFAVSDRGRVPGNILEAYDAAH